MQKAIIGAALGLSIIASSLAVATPASAERLRNKATLNDPDPNKRLCLALPASNVTNGTQAIVYKCDGTPNQDWYEDPGRASGTLDFSNGANRNKCLSSYNYGDGSSVFISDCDWTIDMWVKVDAGNGCFFIQKWLTNQLVGVKAAVMAWGQPIITWHRIAGHDDQIWCPG